MPTLTTRVNSRRVVLRQEYYDGPFTITVGNVLEAERVYLISFSSLSHPINAMTEVMKLIQEGVI